MTNEQKRDRRSVRTQQGLHHALLQLMLEKRYDKITVQDIIDRANAGRSTFYAHYRDKEDLLVSNFERMLADFSDQWLQHDEATGMMSVAPLFYHVQEFHDLYKALVWGRGIELLHQQAQTYLSQRVEVALRAMALSEQEPQVPLALLATHIAATLGTLLRWWLEADMPCTPEEVDGYFQQLVIPVLARLKEPESTVPTQ